MSLQFVLHSGNHKLIHKGDSTEVKENGYWQGTIVYMEITTSKEIDPNDVVDKLRNLNPIAERSILVALQKKGQGAAS